MKPRAAAATPSARRCSSSTSGRTWGATSPAAGSPVARPPAGGPNVQLRPQTPPAGQPAKAPQSLINRLHREVAAIVRKPDVQEKLIALGFDPEDLPHQFAAPDLGTTSWGTLRLDHSTMQTSLDGVFAAGDIVRGASLVVWAIRDGRDAAAAMHKYLAAKASVERIAA